MVWGYEKAIYRLNTESSREDALERNALAALEAVPLETMRRFVIRAHRFADAYRHGLDGAQLEGTKDIVFFLLILERRWRRLESAEEGTQMQASVEWCPKKEM
ncbi:hypothetical protein C8J57DRAFT_1223199 [Mycena rebaudengoi]|nr:hypothetical protein C8J57DRAFT_1223199 [Mycena rebaudengoi]